MASTKTAKAADIFNEAAAGNYNAAPEAITSNWGQSGVISINKIDDDTAEIRFANKETGELLPRYFVVKLDYVLAALKSFGAQQPGYFKNGQSYMYVRLSKNGYIELELPRK